MKLPEFKTYEISKKRCVNCIHARMTSERAKEDTLRCGLASKAFYRTSENSDARVWIISMALTTLNVCSHWEELTDKERIKSRLLGEGVPPRDPRKGEMLTGHKGKPPKYAYLSADTEIRSMTEEEIDAQMWTDKNTYTVPEWIIKL